MAGDAAQCDYFGHSVAVSADGTIAMIGAWGRGRGVGTAYAFSQSGGVWTQQQKLTASDWAAGSRFGSSLGLSANGATAIVGSRGNGLGPGRRLRVHAVGQCVDPAAEADGKQRPPTRSA